MEEDDEELLLVAPVVSGGLVPVLACLGVCLPGFVSRPSLYWLVSGMGDALAVILLLVCEGELDEVDGGLPLWLLHDPLYPGGLLLEGVHGGVLVTGGSVILSPDSFGFLPGDPARISRLSPDVAYCIKLNLGMLPAFKT